jgi:hypothetical protein
MKKTKRIVAGILAAFFGFCIVSSVIDRQFKGTGLFVVFTLVLGSYALFGDTAFKKPQ